MFKRQNRLPRGIRYYNSSFFSTPFFVLKAKKNGLALNRFGIVVSKKVDKKAVIRNKIKRVLRKIILSLDKEIVHGYDMLFIMKPEIANKTEDKIIFAIKEVFAKAGCLKQ